MFNRCGDAPYSLAVQLGKQMQYVSRAFAFKISVFHFRRVMSLFGQNNNEEQCSEAEDGKIPRYFSRG